MFVFVVSLAGWMLLTSRGAKLFSWPIFAMGLQIALFWAFLLWLYYIALEPFVRRMPSCSAPDDDSSTFR